MKIIAVYGSLRLGFYNFNKYLQNNVAKIELGSIKGKLFHIENKGYPALTKGFDEIACEIMYIENNIFEKIINNIDMMENYMPENHNDNEYNRILMEVNNYDKNTKQNAYVYMYNPTSPINKNDKLIHIPNGDWREYMNLNKK